MNVDHRTRYVGSAASTRAATSSAPAVQPMPALEWSTEYLGDRYEPVESWAHLDRIVDGIGAPGTPYIVVQRVADPGRRFAQCLGAPDRLVIEVGARDAASGRSEVWRIRRGRLRFERVDVHTDPDRRELADVSGVMTARDFGLVARDWLSVGVVLEFAADRLDLDLE